MLFRSALIVLVCLTLSAPALAAEPVIVAGTGDSQELLRVLAEDYQQLHPDQSIDVPDSIGSGGGVKAAARGIADFGRLARPIKDKEKVHNLQYQVFAFSPVVFVTNASVSGIDGLTLQQIIDIFSGKITNWSEVGGLDSSILVTGREKGDSSRSVIEKKVSGFKEIERLAGRIFFSTPEAMEVLVKDEHSIGYLPLAMAHTPGLHILTLDGVEPSPEAVLNGSYKLVSPFGLAWKEPLRPEARQFLGYLGTERARKIMSTFGVVPAAL